MTGIETIKKSSVVELAIGRIHDLIKNNDLKEGDRLPAERQLAEMLGISRNSLREAIRVLDMLGVLRVDHGSGMVLDASRVSDSVTLHLSFALLLKKEKLRELFEARIAIETECAALAAERATAEDIAELRATFDELAASGSDRSGGIQAELRLHALIAKAARNAVLEKMLASLGDILRESRETTVSPSGVSAETIESQSRIIAAIEGQDVAAARDLMRRHIGAIAERYRKSDLS
ncbi:MAG TPA: FadR/GntR family transcriptional regulator [Rectinemataceae bacterium]|nr:FadR/GntR family transcriptional regulator [Rectinemataceae bacterium]